MSAERRLGSIGVLALGALMGVGCFHIDPPEGRFSCDPGPCPHGLTCAEDHVCRREPILPDLATPGTPDMLPTEMPDMAPCPVLYVSASRGNDANSGCSTGNPKHSIGAALSALTLDTREVHVCRGEYMEPGIALTLPLYGGYDCTTWQRTATYGYPSFDGTNETVLLGVGVDSAVTVKSGSVVLDGVTVKEDATGQVGMTRA